MLFHAALVFLVAGLGATATLGYKLNRAEARIAILEDQLVTCNAHQETLRNDIRIDNEAGNLTFGDLPADWVLPE